MTRTTTLERVKEKSSAYWRRVRRPPAVVIDGVELGVDYDNWSAQAVRGILNGTYERDERRIVRRMIQPGDRVLEIGGAIGLISMLTARIVGIEKLVVYEANPVILAEAKRNYARNGLEQIDVRHAAVVGRDSPEDEIEFFVHRNFWSSSLLEKEGAVEKVRVPAARLDRLVEQHRPNVLVMDVEGAEHAILVGADLSAFDKICVEVHTRYIGAAKANELLRSVLDQGFLLDLEQSASETLYFFRPAA